MDNTVTLCGNVTGDPEVRFTPSGIAVTSFDIAVNRRWKDPATQEDREDTMFIQCQAWRGLGENCAESISKGQRIITTGRLEQNKWEADDGTARSKHRLVVQDVGPSLMFGKSEFTRIDRSARANAAATDAGEPAPTDAAAASATAAGGEEPF